MAEGQNGVTGVKSIGGANADDFGVWVGGQHFLCVWIAWHSVGGGLLGTFGKDVADGDEFTIGMAFDDLGVTTADVTEANNQKLHFFHA